MYQVNLGNKILYYPASEDACIYDSELNEEIGMAGEFSFKVPPSNPLYPELVQGALITILRDHTELWRGEIRDIKIDFAKIANVYCVEDLAWLGDEFLTPASIINETYAQRFQTAIGAYNANRSAERQFAVGYITNVTSSSDCNWTTEYEWSILDSIRNCICKDDGYLRVRRVTSGGVVTRYIDCVKLSDYGVQATQPIEYGYNLLDYVKDSDYSNLTNVLTPYGDELDSEVYEGYNQRLQGTTITDSTSVSVYGRHEKAVVFDGVTELAQLNALAQAYLTRYAQPQLTMEIEAVDLAEIENVDAISIGDSVRVIAAPFAVDQWLYLTQIRRDIQNIDKNTITLSGYVKTRRTLTEQTLGTAEAVKNLPSKSSILEAAFKNVLALINGVDGGYVTFETNSDDQITEIRIANNMDYSQATKCWRWNLGGLAYLDRLTASDDWQVHVAMDMNGQVSADFIKTGELIADNGIYELNMATGSVTMKRGLIGGLLIDETGLGVQASDLNATRVNSNGTLSLCHKVGSSWSQLNYSTGSNVLGLWTAGSTQGGGGVDISGGAPGEGSSGWIRWGWSDGQRSDGYLVSWYNGSDRRLKKNIVSIAKNKVREFFEKINPIKFNYNKNSRADDTVKHYGLIAQDIETVLEDIGEKNAYLIEEKDVVRKDEKGNETTERYKFIHYEELHGWELAAIKDLYEQIAELKTEINELKGA